MLVRAFLDFVRPDEDRIVWIEARRGQVISCSAQRLAAVAAWYEEGWVRELL